MFIIYIYITTIYSLNYRKWYTKTWAKVSNGQVYLHNQNYTLLTRCARQGTSNKYPLLKVNRLVLFIIGFNFYRIIDTIRFGIKSRRAEDWRERRHWYQRMRDEDTDSNLVRLFETFVENAPQLVLQMYILMMLGNSEGMFLG